MTCYGKKIEREYSWLIYFIASLFILYFIYAPAIHIPFYHHDIYKFSFGELGRSCHADVGYDFLYQIARPISAILDCANFKIANSLEKMAYVRLFCILMMSFVMSLVAYFIYHRYFSFINALLISGAIFCLPALQTTIIMGATNLILAILFAWLAYLLIDRLSRAMSKKKVVITIMYALLLLLASFLTYPSLTPFFLMPTLLILLFTPLGEWQKTRLIVVRDTLLFCIGSLIFFGVAKYIQSRHVNQVISGYQFKVTLDFADRIKTLLLMWPSLWNIVTTKIQGYLFYIILLFGCVSALKTFFNNESKTLQSLFEAILLGLLIFILGSVVYLLQPGNWPAARIIFIFQVMSVVLLVWAMMQLSHVIKLKKNSYFLSLICSMFFIAAYDANAIMTQSALNDNMELNFITNKIAERLFSDKKPLRHIHIIASPNNNLTGYPTRDDIFNLNTTIFSGDVSYIINSALLQLLPRDSYQLQNCVFDDNKEGHLQTLQCIRTAKRDKIVLTYSKPNQAFPKSPNMLIVNMKWGQTRLIDLF